MTAKEEQNSELLRKLAAIQELKRTHLISSQNAYRFHTAMLAYEALGKRVHASGGVEYRPSVREVAKSCSITNRAVEIALKKLCGRISTLQRPSFTEDHKVLEFITHKADVKDDSMAWRFDYESFLIEYFARLPQSLGWSEQDALIRKEAFINAFAAMIASQQPYLEYRKTGERITMAEFMETRFHHGHEHALLSLARTAAYSKSWSFELPHEKGELAEALEKNDLARIYEILCGDSKNQVASEHNAFWELEGMRWDILGEESHYLFHSREFFVRAEREHTLRTLETEQRIAISYLYRSGIVDWRDSDPQKKLEAAIANSTTMVTLRQKALDKSKSGIYPEVIVKQEEQSLRYAKYTLLALKKNRVWLLDFLSK